MTSATFSGSCSIATWQVGEIHLGLKAGKHRGTYVVCAPGASRFARRAKPTANPKVSARLDPVLPDCEPRLKHGGHYDVAAPTRARQFRAAQEASQVFTCRSPKPRAKRNSKVRSGPNRAIP